MTTPTGPFLLPDYMPAPVLGGSLALMRRAGGRTDANPCHHCGTDATSSWQRWGTDTERAQHWAGIQLNIRESNSGRDEVDYVADHTQPVTKAVFGCDQHPDPAPGLTHDAECGGHGACGCTQEASDA